MTTYIFSNRSAANNDILNVFICTFTCSNTICICFIISFLVRTERREQFIHHFVVRTCSSCTSHGITKDAVNVDRDSIAHYISCGGYCSKKVCKMEMEKNIKKLQKIAKSQKDEEGLHVHVHVPWYKVLCVLYICICVHTRSSKNKKSLIYYLLYLRPLLPLLPFLLPLPISSFSSSKLLPSVKEALIEFKKCCTLYFKFSEVS